jgi:hypothetical protein
LSNFAFESCWKNFQITGEFYLEIIQREREREREREKDKMKERETEPVKRKKNNCWNEKSSS